MAADMQRSRFFVVPFDPDKPIEEVSSAGIAQKRLKEMAQPMAVGIEFLVTGYKQQMKQEPQAQAVQALMRRVLKGLPETVMTTRQLVVHTKKVEELFGAKKAAAEKAKAEKIPAGDGPPND